MIINGDSLEELKKLESDSIDLIVTDKWFIQNRDKIFKKYSAEELLRDIRNFMDGKGRLNKVLNHFFEEEMYKCRGGRGNLSPMEAITTDDVVEKILTFTKSKPKFYVGDDTANVKSFFRNAGRTAQKVANFPVRQAIDIYSEYSEVGDIVFDFSCGFGSRMSAALLSGRNYFGTDPNKTLCVKLEEYGDFLKDEGLLGGSLFIENDVKFDIYCQGSEMFIPDLLGKVDLCFSSPPYFDLEKYSNDENQSIAKFNEYNLWLKGYVVTTMENCSKYLKEEGYLLVNIKNMTGGKKYPLFDDWFRITKEIPSLVYIETINMKQLSKRDYKGKHFTGVDTDFGNNEPIMVFKKIKEYCNKNPNQSKIVDVWD